MPPAPEALLTPTDMGLFCPPGGFFIDPVRAVKHALITHGHADHARSGHRAVMATRETLAIMAVRYGKHFAAAREEARLGERRRIGEVEVSFHPAGHVLGSAQIAVEWQGLRIVVSGDYKRRRDPTCAPFEVVPCDVFITEATFGLPVFVHPPAEEEIARLMHSRATFPERTHVIGVYALGKAQRVIAHLREAGMDGPIYLHGALIRLCELYETLGVPLGPLLPATRADKTDLKGAIVLAPPSSLANRWSRRMTEPVTAFASGWMRVRARARQRGAELPLIISDHADWPELCATIRDTGAGEIWVTHGREDALVHYARGLGLKARALSLKGYEEEEVDAPEENAEEPVAP